MSMPPKLGQNSANRISDGVHKMKLLIKGAYVMMPLTYVACLLVAFFKCIPFHHQWQINPNPGSESPAPPHGSS
jgi:hypothetical protein